MLSAFFSGSETAYLNLKKYNKDIPFRVNQIISNPKELLITLLTGNTLVNITLAFLGAFLIHEFGDYFNINKTYLLFIEIFCLSIVLLIFGEITPKVIAIRNSISFASFVSIPLQFILILFKPFIFLLRLLIDFLDYLIPVSDEKAFDSEEELKILAALGEEEGAIEEEESEMIQSIIEFNDKQVGEIITPRVDIIGISSTASLDQVMDLICERQFSKIPVFEESIDHIKGILHAREVIPYLIGSRPNINLLSISREPLFVPENKPVDELLKDFKNKRTNIAIVVDEWGGTEGLITLEDIVEEVLGEIRDPYDNEVALINKIKTGIYVVDAKISIYDLEEALDIEFPDERDYDTLGGFILSKVLDIPQKNDSVTYNHCVFSVKTVKDNRIGKIIIKKIDE